MDTPAPSKTAPRADDSGRGGGSIVHALSILRFLSESGESLGVTAIAKRLGISPSSCFNILKTLVAQDVIEFSQTAKTYTIGYGLLHIVHESLSHSRVVPLLAPGMRKLADKFSTAVGLWRITGGERPLLISIAETEASIRIHLTMGQRLPHLAGAVGRCVAAHRTFAPGEFGRIFSKMRLDQPISQDDYLKEIGLARKRGFSIDAGCYMQGVTSVAAPIMDSHGGLAFCLSATMFSGQHPKKDLPVIGEELRLLAGRATG
jgi:IclR family transcriptional regulator, acetate operon repressor